MNIQTTLFLVVCAFLFGIAAGGYIASLRQKDTSHQKEEPSASDLVRLRKDPQSGELEVQLDGQAFHSFSELNETQRAQVASAVDGLKSWLPTPGPVQAAGEKPQADGGNEIGIETEELAAVGSVDAETLQTPIPKTGPASRAKVGSPVEKVGLAEASEPKRLSLLGTLSRVFWSDSSPELLSSISIAVQVNQILQRKLKDTSLEERGICLMELPGQDMVVMIGDDKYDSVSMVPDDEIRGIIQSSVDEWLARSTK